MAVKAYAVLAGGGVKAAALAGCIRAAEEYNVDFIGYGGTSAGSVIALLACVGYDGEHLKDMVTSDVNFSHFLDDNGDSLSKLMSLLGRFDAAGSWKNIERYKVLLSALTTNRHIFQRILSRNGLYHGEHVVNILYDLVRNSPKIKDKFPGHQSITFRMLEAETGKTLKVVCSDVVHHKPYIIPSNSADLDTPVVNAVLASMSYPLVFEPCSHNGSVLVDGGLTSNLPVFLFDEESKNKHTPVIAFNLTTDMELRRYQKGFFRFGADLLATALESSEYLIRDSALGVEYVNVATNQDVGTFSFSTTPDQRRDQFHAGRESAGNFLRGFVKQQQLAEVNRDRLHVWIKPLLKAFAQEFAQETGAADIRASIMLLTDHHTRKVKFHYNMDGDPDINMELAVNAGCSGRAWESRDVAIDDATDPVEDSLSDEQRDKFNRVRPPRKAILAAPLFDFSQPKGASTKDELARLGTIALDTSSMLSETRWTKEKKGFVYDAAKRWADIIATILLKEDLSNVRS